MRKFSERLNRLAIAFSFALASVMALSNVAPAVQPMDADINLVAQLLIESKNPVITTDSAGKDPQTFAALVELAETLAMPVVEGSFCGYANFPRDNPLYLGGNFKPFMDSSDLVLLVRSRIPWYPPSLSPRNAKIVAIDEAPLKNFMVYQNLQADHYLEGSPAASLTMLTRALRAMGVAPEKVGERRERWSREHDKLMSDLRAAESKAHNDNNDDAIDPLTLVVALREAMPRDVVYVDETITHRPLVGRHMAWTRPQSYFYVVGALARGLAWR
jgi:acetolactate synthase I/II/III large subunit